MNQFNTIYIFVLLIIFILFETNNRYISESSDHTNSLDIFSAEDHRTIRRQSARWSLAAKQDMNPVIGLLHANYGTAYQMFLLMNGIREEIMIEKTFMIEKNVVTDVNNKCQSIENINYDMIDNIVRLIGIARQKFNSLNPIDCAFQLIDLIDRYSSEHSNNRLIGLICANYCCGVYWAITDIRTHSQIEKSLRLYIGLSEQKFKNILQIRDMLINKQDKMTTDYSKTCTHYNIDEIGDDYLAKVAGDK